MSISNKVRFEVLKRDQFTCRYCGKKAFVDPGVLLEVREFEQPAELQIDHVHPRSKGGGDEILNLVTACVTCNAGKSDISLSEHAMLAAQGRQLEQLQAHREQLRMMLEWKRGLRSAFEERLAVCERYWADLLGGQMRLTEAGRKALKSLLRNRSGWADEDILEAMEIAVDQYVQYDGQENLRPESVELAWTKIRGICRNRAMARGKPYWDDLLYTRGILRNRLSYLPFDALSYLENAHVRGVSIETLQSIAKRATSWQGEGGFEPAVNALLSPECAESGDGSVDDVDNEDGWRDGSRPDLVDALLGVMPPIVRADCTEMSGSASERMESLAYSIERHAPVHCSGPVPDLRDLNALLSDGEGPEPEGALRYFLYWKRNGALAAVGGDALCVGELLDVARQTAVGDSSALEFLQSPAEHYLDAVFRDSLLGGLIRRAFLGRFPLNAHEDLQGKLDDLRAVYGIVGPLEVMQYLPRDRKAVWEDVQNIVQHIFGVSPVRTHAGAAHYLRVMHGYPQPFDAVTAWGRSLLAAYSVESWADFADSDEGQKTLTLLRVPP